MKWKPRLFVVKRELKKSTKGTMRWCHLWRKLSEPNVTDLPSDPVVVGLCNPLGCCILLKQRDIIITFMQLQRLNCARRTNLRCFKVKTFFVSSAAEKGSMRKRWSFSMCVQLVVSIFSYIPLLFGVLLVELAVDEICICCNGEWVRRTLHGGKWISHRKRL